MCQDQPGERSEPDKLIVEQSRTACLSHAEGGPEPHALKTTGNGVDYNGAPKGGDKFILCSAPSLEASLARRHLGMRIEGDGIHGTSW